MIHRVASSGRYSDGLVAIQLDWSIDDVLDANDVLDMFERLEDKQAQAAESEG